MNAMAAVRRSTVSMPRKVTLPPTALASLASAGVSCLHGWQLDDQKFITIGLPASLARSIVPDPRKLGRLMLFAGRTSLTNPSPVLTVGKSRRGVIAIACSASSEMVDSTAAATNTRLTATARFRRDHQISPELVPMTSPYSHAIIGGAEHPADVGGGRLARGVREHLVTEGRLCDSPVFGFADPEARWRHGQADL